MSELNGYANCKITSLEEVKLNVSRDASLQRRFPEEEKMGSNNSKTEEKGSDKMGSNNSKSEEKDSDKLKVVSELKRKYSLWYNKYVHLNPFIRQVTTPINTFYVDNKMTAIYEQNTESGEVKKIWQLIDSYKDVFNIEGWKSFEWFVIEGESGFGKSLLSLQLAFDWCEKKGFLKDIDLFFLIRLKEMNGVQSLYEAIRISLLVETSLSADSIKTIITSDDISGVLVLDGLEDYNETNESVSDFMKVIKGTKLATFRVIITTNGETRELLPNKPNVLRLRLCGFDLQIQKRYIERVLENKLLQPPKPIKIIYSQLEQDYVVADILQIPLFFAMYIYMRPGLTTSISVTQFFEHLIGALFENCERKGSHKEIQEHTAKLSKFCLLRFCDVNNSSFWRKSVVADQTESTCYETYIKVGILMEVRDLHLNLHNGTDQNGMMKSRIRFLHSIFQEWYSALHLVHLAKKKSLKKLRQYASCLNPMTHQFVFRFTCGMDREAGYAILRYLEQSLEECIDNETKSQIRMTLIFCHMEIKTENIEKSLKGIMKDLFQFRILDSTLFQRSQVHVLRIASNLEIPVKVKVDSCFGSIDTTGKCIILTSGQSIPNFSCEHLRLTALGQNISSEDATKILTFAFACPHLKFLEFYGGLLPMKLKCNKNNDFKFTVKWVAISFDGEAKYTLNLTSGKWMNDRRQLTAKKYSTLERAQLDMLMDTVRYRKKVVKKVSARRTHPKKKSKKKTAVGYPSSPIKHKSFTFT